MAGDSSTPDKEEFIGGLSRGLSVLTAFSAGNPDMTITEAARATGLSPAAARRCLLTLVHLGYASQHRGRFSLRPRVLELGASFSDSTGLSEAVQPALESLRDATGDSASFAVLDGLDILMVLHLPTARLIREVSSNGARGPAYLVPTGRVLLANLPDDQLGDYLDAVILRPRTSFTVSTTEQLLSALSVIRRQGFAVVVDEIEHGLTAIAVPVRTPDGTVVAGVGCALVSSVEPLDDIVFTRVGHLREAAARIERQFKMFPALAQALTPDRIQIR